MVALRALGLGIVAASFGASVGALYLLQYLYTQRRRSGADWFIGNIASVALFCLSYGAALLVFDPIARTVLEAVAFVSVCFMGPFFLAFGLSYTGRQRLVRTPLFGIVGAVPLLTVGLVATNAAHGLVWTGFQFEPLFGLATVTYTIQPWGVFALLFSIGTAAVGSLLLIGAILSYGPLYRREATAVILSTVPPSVGVFVWLFEIGPTPELHLTAPLMLVHVTLDAYAFIGTHMFETNPATQRAAERSGLDSLSDLVIVLDTEEQIVRLNDRAEALLFEGPPPTLPVPMETVLGVSLNRLRETGEISIQTKGRKTFAVSYTPLTDSTEESVGSMVVLYDVSEVRQREQQLSVLNRVLRHNLRNETTVISGYAGLLESDVENPEHATQARTIAAASNRLHSIAEKVRNFDDVQQRVLQPERVSIAETVEGVVETTTTSHDAATVDWTVEPSDLRLRTDPVILSLLLENIVENAIIHSESAETTVRISVSKAAETRGGVRFKIRDSNERIPEDEIETLRAGEETSLRHGDGIGLWIVYWCVRKLHGDISFEYDDGNVLTMTVPAMTE